MSREIKRVPVDFDWPIDKTWHGYLIPQRLNVPNCTECDGTGSTTALRWVTATAHMLLMLDDDLDAQRREAVATYTDLKSGLEVRCVAVGYRDFPTVEWTVYFKNTGKADTPILAGIQALDARWERAGADEFLLHHEFGTFYPNSPTDFMPQESRLEPSQSKRFIPYKGRACADVMPYFNLETSKSSGVIVVVGWPGAWAAEFARDAKTGVHVTAGQELTHLRLHPGEEIRTPSILAMFWSGANCALPPNVSPTPPIVVGRSLLSSRIARRPAAP